MFGSKATLVAIILSVSVSACSKSTAGSTAYVWRNVTTAASYPQSYTYPEQKKLTVSNTHSYLSAIIGSTFVARLAPM